MEPDRYPNRSIRGPGYGAQGTARVVFRVVGFVLLSVAVVLIVIAGTDLFSAANANDVNATPTRFWMFFVAIPLLGVGAFCLQAGFAGAGARYVAGETMPVVRDSMDYLRVGGGAVTCHACGASNSPAAGFCHSCGQPYGRRCAPCGEPNDASANFCDSCGTSLAAT